MLRTIHVVEMRAGDPLGANGLSKAVLELSLAQSRAADVHLVIHGAWPGGRPVPEEVTRHGGGLLDCALALRKLARDDTVVHVHSVWSWLVLAPLLIPRFRICRFVLSPHGAFAAQALRSSAAKKRLFWPVLRLVLKAFHQLHAASGKELTELTRLQTGLPIVIVPNAVSEPGITPARATKRKTIGYLGRIHPIKGVLDLIRAWSAIERDYPDWELRIVGDPHDLAYWRAVVKEAESSRSISFSPAIDPGAVWRFLGECELVAIPSLSENFCYVVAEACLAGTAVAMTDQVPWPQDGGGDMGWRGPTGVEGVTHSLRAALNADSSDRRLRADRGRRFVRLACSPARVGRRSLDAYAQISLRGDYAGAPQRGAPGSPLGCAEGP